MTSLDDQIHQLFSSLLKNSKNNNELTFNQQLIDKGEGPYLNNKLDLGPWASLLGHGHPLIYKSRLESALYPELYVAQSKTLAFIQSLNHFLQATTKVEIYAHLSHSSDSTSLTGGRHESFLSQRDIKFIQDGGKLSFPNIFPFPISLSNKKSSENVRLSASSYCEALSLLRLLQLGNFYGGDGHIVRYSHQISQQLDLLPSVNKIEGLLIYLEQDKKYSFLSNEETTIYLPLFFKPFFLKELKKIIME